MSTRGLVSVLASVLAAVGASTRPCSGESRHQEVTRVAASGTPTQSVAELRRRISELQASTPDDRAAIGRAYLVLANECLRDKQFAECSDAARQAADMLKYADASPHSDFIRNQDDLEECHVVLGRAQAHLGHLTTAKGHFQDALKIAQASSSCANRRVALRLHDLSMVVACTREVGDSLSPSGSLSPSDVAMYLCVLGTDDVSLAAYRRSMEESLAAASNGITTGGAQTGLSLERLGAVYYALGAYKESANVRRRALAFVSDQLGIQSAASIACAQNLALTLITLESTVTPDASALIRRVAAPTRMSLQRSHQLAALADQIADCCCVALDHRNEVDLYTMLVRLRDLPPTDPSPYGSIEQLCDDIRAVDTDPKACVRLLNACVGWYGPSMRMLARYRSLTRAHAECVRQVFGLPDPDGMALLGILATPTTVTRLQTGDTKTPSPVRLQLADPHGTTIARWTILPRGDGASAGFLIWDESLWGSAPQAMEAAVWLSSVLDPSMLPGVELQAVSRIVAEETNRVRDKAYATRKQALDALHTRLQPHLNRSPKLLEMTNVSPHSRQ